MNVLPPSSSGYHHHNHRHPSSSSPYHQNHHNYHHHHHHGYNQFQNGANRHHRRPSQLISVQSSFHGSSSSNPPPNNRPSKTSSNKQQQQPQLQQPPQYDLGVICNDCSQRQQKNGQHRNAGRPSHSQTTTTFWSSTYSHPTSLQPPTPTLPSSSSLSSSTSSLANIDAHKQGTHHHTQQSNQSNQEVVVVENQIALSTNNPLAKNQNQPPPTVGDQKQRKRKNNRLSINSQVENNGSSSLNGSHDSQPSSDCTSQDQILSKRLSNIELSSSYETTRSEPLRVKPNRTKAVAKSTENVANKGSKKKSISHFIHKFSGHFENHLTKASSVSTTSGCSSGQSTDSGTDGFVPRVITSGRYGVKQQQQQTQPAHQSQKQSQIKVDAHAFAPPPTGNGVLIAPTKSPIPTDTFENNYNWLPWSLKMTNATSQPLVNQQQGQPLATINVMSLSSSGNNLRPASVAFTNVHPNSSQSIEAFDQSINVQPSFTNESVHNHRDQQRLRQHSLSVNSVSLQNDDGGRAFSGCSCVQCLHSESNQISSWSLCPLFESRSATSSLPAQVEHKKKKGRLSASTPSFFKSEGDHFPTSANACNHNPQPESIKDGNVHLNSNENLSSSANEAIVCSTESEMATTAAYNSVSSNLIRSYPNAEVRPVLGRTQAADQNGGRALLSQLTASTTGNHAAAVHGRPLTLPDVEKSISLEQYLANMRLSNGHLHSRSTVGYELINAPTMDAIESSLKLNVSPETVSTSVAGKTFTSSACVTPPPTPENSPVGHLQTDKQQQQKAQQVEQEEKEEGRIVVNPFDPADHDLIPKLNSPVLNCPYPGIVIPISRRRRLSNGSTLEELQEHRRRRKDLDLSNSVVESGYSTFPPRKSGLLPHFYTRLLMTFHDVISTQIWKLFLIYRQTPELYERKLSMRATIYQVLRKHFCHDLFIVGSSLNGLGSNSSDVDMCIVLPPRSEPIDQHKFAVDVLEYVQAILEKNDLIQNAILIRAKVPILKFRDSSTQIDADLNVNNIVGIRNTQLIKCYTRLDWRVQPLAIVVKAWANANQINNAHNRTLSSYTLVLMLIHFLQSGCHPPLLPCLHHLMPQSFRSDSDVKTLDLFEELPGYRSLNEQTLGQLFLAFLQYYAYRFNYRTDAISVRAGRSIPKNVTRDYQNEKNTPSQWRYICCEEPFDRTNTARSVNDESAFLYIVNVFQQSHQRLSDGQDLTHIIGRANGIGQRPPADPFD